MRYSAAALVLFSVLAASGIPLLRLVAPGPATTTALARPAAATHAPRNFEPPALANRAAYIPPQCYAQTRDTSDAQAHQGCFVCHQESRPPNYVNDAGAQSKWSMPGYATHNRWLNLRSPPPPATLDDAALLSWIRTSNYEGAERGLTLAQELASPPPAWDANGDGAWNGYVPDCFFHIDDSGFDTGVDGSKTGWRAYAWMPTPGMFLPTNGSLGDALIRLPPPYRKDAQGRESEAIYRINLAIVEAYVTRVSVPIAATDERSLGSDLDGDGALGLARRIGFVWPPKTGRTFHYVGQAAELDPKRDGWPAAGLFPRGTEFLHSVRYLDVVDDRVRMAARMKELRYMRKARWLDYGQLEQIAQAETREKFKSPDKLKRVLVEGERGATTGIGWVMQGFIESADGRLRPQTLEETAACVGCHGGLGATTDATFSFARKLGAGSFRDGWFHPNQHDWADVPERKRADGRGEYTHYLLSVGGADDFRSNAEVRRKFFDDDGKLKPAPARQLQRDVSSLLMPSPARALALNRAYLGLVRVQRFDAGRDVSVGAPPQLHARVSQDAPTGVSVPLLPAWKAGEKPGSAGAPMSMFRRPGESAGPPHVSFF